MIKYFSTFSGIGGFELGIGGGAKCVGFSEVNKYAIQVYQSHFPKHKNYGDITKIIADELPDFDLLCGGFPCQAFSIAGKRGGFDDTRGTLFFELARIARVKRPRLLFFENVKGLLSHDGGRTFDTIIRTIDELGYDCQWQVLNSAGFGVPQNRERVFIIGHLRGTPRPQVFPLTQNTITSQIRIIGTTKGEENTRIGERDQVYSHEGLMGSLKATDYKQPPQILQLNNPVHSNDRVYGPGGLAPTLNTMQGGNRQPFVALTEKRTEEAKQIRRQASKGGKDYSPRRAKYLEARTDGQIGTITASRNLDNLLTDSVKVRKLTPIECERLQGFPDNWTDCVSDSQRYKCCGNAVTVNVIKAIAERLL